MPVDAAKLIDFEFSTPEGDHGRVSGYIVPGTEGLIAVDERSMDHWFVTHLPTGRRIVPPHHAKLSVREQALGFARRWCAEAVKFDFDLRTTDAQAIERWWRELGYGNQAEFWTAVL